MIKKLRIRFICAAMAALLLVLAAIFGIMGVLSYRQIVQNADSVLTVLKDNGGEFPDSKPGDNQDQVPADNNGTGQNGSQDTTQSTKPKDEQVRMSPETPYESRYFTVTLSEDGDVTNIDTGNIASVDSDQAADYAQTAASRDDDEGFIDRFRYIRYTSDGETNYIFLDCGRDMSSYRSYLLIGVCVAAGGMLTVLLLLIIFSKRAVRPFAENYEKQKRFITDAGHELKTPLTIISADTEVLEMDVGENEWLTDIRTQTARMADLTNSLVQLARMEEKPQIEMIEFPLSDVVDESVDAFQSLAKTKEKTLTSSVQPMISMVGEEKSIRQLVTILLDNAVKYSDDGGRIEVGLSKQKNTIELTVFNTAESVPKESVSHLFERFYRMDKSRNSSTGGYGLGLSIASAIVNTHKGKISASTKDEKSLLVTVTFPAS
ncbi:MAG: sensor histidine kinase [Anaerovoracaceae bacterium]|jgi:two-component system sensor histidine kinase CiaH